MGSISASYVAGFYSSNQVLFSRNTAGYNNQSKPDQPSSQTSQDTVSISDQGYASSRQEASKANPAEKGSEPQQDSNKQENSNKNLNLTEQELKKVQDLKKRDTEVKAHEQAHLAAAGQYAAGGASFSYETGPDGVKYAVAGEVPIDISKESTPEATILKMQTVKRAALAPASPSSADRMIAAQADAKVAQARQQQMKEQNAAAQGLLTSEIDQKDTNSPKKTDQSDQSSPATEAGEGSTRKTLRAAAYKNIAALAQ